MTSPRRATIAVVPLPATLRSVRADLVAIASALETLTNSATGAVLLHGDAPLAGRRAA